MSVVAECRTARPSSTPPAAAGSRSAPLAGANGSATSPPTSRAGCSAARAGSPSGAASARSSSSRPTESLPFKDASFDLCLCFNSLHCFDRPQAALSEVARCLRPGGRLVGDSAIRGAGRRYDALIAVYRRAGVFGRVPDLAELRSWLDAAHLRDLRLQAVGLDRALRRAALSAPERGEAGAASQAGPTVTLESRQLIEADHAVGVPAEQRREALAVLAVLDRCCPLT
jgi:SAM-dependent methyltransferase